MLKEKRRPPRANRGSGQKHSNTIVYTRSGKQFQAPLRGDQLIAEKKMLRARFERRP